MTTDPKDTPATSGTDAEMEKQLLKEWDEQHKPETSGSADQAVRDAVKLYDRYYENPRGFFTTGICAENLHKAIQALIQTAEQAAELLKHRDHLNEEVGKLYERDQSLRRRVKDLEGALEEISASDLSHKWVKLHAKEAINQSRSGEKV